MKYVLPFFSIAVLFLTIRCAAAAEETLAEVIERMKQRVDEIAQLKEDHVVGETRDGYLAVVNPPESKEAWEQADKLVQAENQDRTTIYKAVAERTDTSVEQVALQRARQIYENSEEGVLLQNMDGTWYKK